jgi:hypothetical protein
LIWLAYLDLRSPLFGAKKFPLITASNNHKDFLNVLVDLDALKSLRAVTNGRSYLSDCFGDSCPQEEVREDLIQEPCHILCDDILSILSKIKRQQREGQRVKVRDIMEDCKISIIV